MTTSALKKQAADPEDVAEVVGWMKRLNNRAAQLAVAHEVRGGTDITGFSLLGHGAEMAAASGVGLQFDFAHIPVLDFAKRYAQEWHFPGGASDNRLYFQKQVTVTGKLEEWELMLLFDPQTSGGLLLSVPEERAAALLREAAREDFPIWEVGRVVEGAGIEVVV